MMMWIFTKAIMEGRPIPVFNHGDMHRDFTHVSDIVAGHVHRTIVAELAGRAVVTVPSTYLQAALDFSTEKITMAPDPPGFAIHAFHDGILLWTAVGISALVLLLIVVIAIRFNARSNPTPQVGLARRPRLGRLRSHPDAQALPLD